MGEGLRVEGGEGLLLRGDVVGVDVAGEEGVGELELWRWRTVFVDFKHHIDCSSEGPLLPQWW